MVFSELPPFSEERFITNRRVVVSIIYLTSLTRPVDNWEQLVAPALIDFEAFYAQYVNYSWDWRFYTINVPDLDPRIEDMTISGNPFVFDSLPALHRNFPQLAEQIFNESDIIWIYLNSN